MQVALYLMKNSSVWSVLSEHTHKSFKALPQKHPLVSPFGKPFYNMYNENGYAIL